MTLAVSIAQVDLSGLKLREMFYKTGVKVDLMGMTPHELRYYLNIREVTGDVEMSGPSETGQNAFNRMAHATANENQRRFARGLPPMVSNELRRNLMGRNADAKPERRRLHSGHTRPVGNKKAT
jgi:hypothetical protein